MAENDKRKPAPRPSHPPETRGEQSRDLLVELRNLQRQLGVWPEAMIQRLVAFDREVKEQRKEEERAEVAGWRQERATWAKERVEGTHSLNASAYTLNRLAVELEKRHDQVIWGWTPAQWVTLLLGGMLSALLIVGGGLTYRDLGPPNSTWTRLIEKQARLEAELSDYRQKWEAVRPAEQKRAEKNLANKQAGT